MNILDELVAKGVAGDVIVAVAKLIVDAEQTERIRAAARERMRAVRERSRTHANSSEQGIPPSLLPDLSSSDSKEEERLSLVATGREFAEFWKRYPHKVGKRAAEKSFRSARKRASFETIMAGLERYAAKTDDRPWCNPATWLNQDRWEDQEGPSQEGNGKALSPAVIEKREHELRLRLHGQGVSPYEIEQEIRRGAAMGAAGPSNVTQLRSSIGVARGQNQDVEGQLALPKQRS